MSGAVAKAANQAATKPSPQAALKQSIDLYRPIIERALPRHVTLERFISSVLTVCRQTPGLLACDPMSIVAGAVMAAQKGLEPDGEMCALVPRGGKAVFQLMYKGAIQLARNAKSVDRVVARTVYEADQFEFSYGTVDEGLRHKPASVERRGPAVFWYAIAWHEGALVDFVVLTKADVEYHRAFSAQPNGQAWSKSYDAMARKTAVWELLKLVPKAAEILALGVDDRSLRLNTTALMDQEGADAVGVDPDDVPEVTYERARPAAIDITGAQEVTGDPDTAGQQAFNEPAEPVAR